jgi:hypothetical protein
MNDRTREFVAGAIEAQGGIVEAEGDVLRALLAPADAARLGLSEETVISFVAERTDDQVDGRLGAPLTERLARLWTAIPLAPVALPAELPRSLPEHLPALLNAVRGGEVQKVPGVERYLLLHVRATSRGDELRSALALVAVRLSDGALVTPPRIDGAYPTRTSLPNADEKRACAAALRRWFADEGVKNLDGPLSAVRRRARRDLERLAEYYRSLDHEMAQAVRRARADDERARRETKRAGLPDDLAARRVQLRDRMRVRLSLRVLAGVLAESPTVSYEIPIRRRTQSGAVRVRLRLADGTFEGPPCAACLRTALRLYFCDDRLHVLCDRCGHAGRLDAARCRACAGVQPEAVRIGVDDPTAQLFPAATPGA